jgi:hypothetical protein
MKNIIIVILVVIVVGGIIWFLSTQKSEEPTLPEEEMTSFEECVIAGYTILESYPRQCQIPEGETFIEEIELSDSYNHAGRITNVYQKDGKDYLDINFIKFLLFVDEGGDVTTSPTSIYGESDEEGDCEPGPNPYCIVDNDKTINSYEVSENILIIPSYYPGSPIPYEELEESLAASPFFRIQIENNIITKMHQIYVP